MKAGFIFVTSSTTGQKRLLNFDHIIEVIEYKERATFVMSVDGRSEGIMTTMPWGEAYDIIIVNNGRSAY